MAFELEWSLAAATTALGAGSGVLACVLARRLLAGLPRPVVLPVLATAMVGAGLPASVVLAAWLGAVPVWWLPVALVLCWLAPALAVADLVACRLPDALTLAAYPLLAAGLAAAGLSGGDAALGPRAFAGAVLFGGGHLLVHLLVPGALGAGDVKLSGALGAPLGALGLLVPAAGAVLAAVLTASVACGARVAGVWRDRAGVPYGPGLLLACWVLAAFPGAVLPGGP